MNKINKVAIFGMGKSGKSALRLAKKQKLDVYAVSEGDPSSWYEREELSKVVELCSCYSQDNFKEYFPKMDEIVISPGIPTTHPVLKEAQNVGVPIISEIEFSYRAGPQVPVIAVTGTNGKTTTTTMISEALKLLGKKVFCGGNIGLPYSELPLSDEKFDYAVIEVSSFQLETIEKFHPVVGLILNIFPNHSERYESVRDYALAKFNLLKNMTKEDHLILGTENPYLAEIKDHQVKKSFFTKGDLPKDFCQKFSFKKANVRGEHNEANFFATYEVLKKLELNFTDDFFQDFINSFAGVPHRLEFVLTKDGLTVYNDAKSTNAASTVTAIKAFKDTADDFFLILGGKLRNESDKILPDLLPFKKQITKIFSFGEVSERLKLELQNDFAIEALPDLKSVLKRVKELGLKGNLVFSPAHPSFDQFSNYVDRGEKFKSWVRETFSA